MDKDRDYSTDTNNSEVTSPPEFKCSDEVIAKINIFKEITVVSLITLVTGVVIYFYIDSCR